MRSRLALLVALIPAVALVAGLPFANRLDPVVFGLPFLLAWILGWVLATPAFLAAAYLLQPAASVGPLDGARR
jgi:Protein of unknown function (DUF3311)